MEIGNKRLGCQEVTRPVNDLPHSPLSIQEHSSIQEFSWVQPLKEPKNANECKQLYKKFVGENSSEKY